MDLLDLIANAHGGNGLDNIGRQFGLDRAQTQAALEQLAPVVAAGLRRNANSPRGMLELVDALQRGNHERYLDDADAVQFDRAVEDGNGILGHIFGSKNVSRGVAMQTANQTGIDSAILKQLLPIIASMVLGSLTRKMGGGRSSPAPRGGGGLGDILGDILGGGASQRAPGPLPGGGGLGDILGDILGGGRSAGSRHQSEEPAFDYDKDAFNKHRDVLEETLGRGSSSGNAAEDLLSSVERHLRRM